MLRAPSARRFAIVPPENQSRETARPAIAYIVQGSNLAVETNVVTVPEDHRPNSQMILKGTRGELENILDLDQDGLDDFDFGLDDEISGQHDRAQVFAQAGIIEVKESANSSDVDLLQSIPPAIPEIALAQRIVLTDDELFEFNPSDDHDAFTLVNKKPTVEAASEDEEKLVARAYKVAKEIKAQPNRTFELVYQAQQAFTRQGKDLFWPVLRNALAHPPALKGEPIATTVAKYTQQIDTIALQVLAHEAKTNCFYLEALEIGFHALPAYRDLHLRLAFNKALRERVSELRLVTDRFLKEMKVGTNEKQTDVVVLERLAKIFPSQRNLVWQFHQLMRKQPTAETTHNQDIVQQYSNCIDSIATQVVAATLPRVTLVYPLLEIGYQLLPHTANTKEEFKLRKALLQKIQTELILHPLQKTATALIQSVKYAPFNGAKLIREAVAPLDQRQQSVFPEAVKRAIAHQLVSDKKLLAEQITTARKLIELMPKRRNDIITKMADDLSPLHRIHFHEALGSSLLNDKLFGDYQTLGMKVPKPRAKLPPVPHSKANLVNLKAEEKLEEIEEIEPEPSLWAQFTTGLKKGVTEVKNWFGAIKQDISNFSFSNFLRGHKTIVGATTVIAAMNGYQGYQNITTVVEPPLTANNATYDQNTGAQDLTRVRLAAYSRSMGTDQSGRKQVLNYAPVIIDVPNIFGHLYGSFTPTGLNFASRENTEAMTNPDYTAVSLHADETVRVTNPWQYRVDQHDAMANIYNALDAYMRSSPFRLSFPEYVAGAQDQSIIFENLARYNSRAHHILHRIAHGDTISFGTTPDGNIAITDWTNAQGINMLASEPHVVIRTNSLSNLGEFSRSPNMLARRVRPSTHTEIRVAMITPQAQ